MHGQSRALTQVRPPGGSWPCPVPSALVVVEVAVGGCQLLWWSVVESRLFASSAAGRALSRSRAISGGEPAPDAYLPLRLPFCWGSCQLLWSQLVHRSCRVLVLLVQALASEVF